jgi:multimeric flavodoxin WrbA
VPRLLIVFHSQGGSTQRLAEAALRGARREAGVETVLRRAFDAGVDDLVGCQGLLVVTPENLGYMAGAIKDFFDRTFYPAQGRVDGVPYAVLVKAGNDGTNTAVQVERIARGYKLRKVAEPIIVRGDVCSEDVTAAEDLGQALAAGLALGIY